MGLIAFIGFVVPWMIFAAWMFRLPSAIRLGAPSTPWRPLTDFAGPARDQRRETNPYNSGRNDGSGRTGGDKHSPIGMAGGGALGTSVEPTEPTDKIG
ncbi:hypothetical protein [Methylobacterium sp. E-046]|jgi:hypothetical protein|uniref:hypothetical protein n=1 Tax=Methylobacterium sp. E-046 TaxID=2836576 RepID=UPI001FBB6638|nr:hypothetical protein [Methylobacterium sp. E-046]MCJ2103223.1 hypothetical protein [Methylobacterium sp. E-046]